MEKTLGVRLAWAMSAPRVSAGQARSSVANRAAAGRFSLEIFIEDEISFKNAIPPI
jgi:hypothetical protein